MKYVGVTPITRFNAGRIYWFKFCEDDLGPLDDVKAGQLVLIDTGRGFRPGRIVKRSSGGVNLALKAGMREEDVTREVIALLYDRQVIYRNAY